MQATSYDVVVIGGGAAGLSAALVLGRARRRVAVVDAGMPRNAPAEHMHGFLSRDGLAPADLLATGCDELRSYGVELDDGREIPRSAVFMRPTLVPRGTQLIDSLGCELDAAGFVRADRDGQASVAGLWSAGNVSNPRAQVITAAGEGSAAAISINTDLVQEDTGR
jgi:thioredoxin reductase